MKLHFIFALPILLVGGAANAAPPDRVLETLSACLSESRKPARLPASQETELAGWLNSPKVSVPTRGVRRMRHSVRSVDETRKKDKNGKR
jgi:hypothetical protein